MTTSESVILHLVKKTVALQVVDFCLICSGESYSAAQEKIYRMVAKEVIA